MKRISPTAIYFLVSLVAFIGLAGLYWSVHQSINGQIVRTEGVLKEVLKEKYRKDHEKSLASTLANVEADREKLLGFFVTADQTVDFIERVESIGNLSGTSVAISSINADNLSEKPAGTVGKLGVHVTTVGTWPSIMEALLLAEQMPYSVSINNLRMDVTDLQSTDGKALPTRGWKVDFDIEVLSIK